jgi:predicted RNase H-like nuclease
MGIDACPMGWAAAILQGGTVRVIEVPSLASLPPAHFAAIDIPIGLAAVGKRDCDLQARERLGPRRSSVFITPPRDVVEKLEYREANAFCKERHGWGLSAQAFHLFPRIREAEQWVLSLPEPWRVAESHPELAFLDWVGEPPPSKHTAHGLDVRRAATEAMFPGGWALDTKRAKEDDVLDALALLWVACQVAVCGAVTLPEEAPLDHRGLPMRIVRGEPRHRR